MQQITPKLTLALLLAFSLPMVSAVPAHTQDATEQKDQGATTPAGKFIQDLGDKAVGVIADNNLSQDQRTRKYNSLLHEAFDMQAIGKFVLGRAWKTATPQQQQEFMKLFEANVIKIYGDRLSFYSGEGFSVKSSRQEDNNDSVVTSEVDHPNGAQPTMVDWRVRQTNGKFAVVDVVIEGVSQSITQRQEYASIIERNGGNIDALLDLMRQRAQKPQSPQQQN